MHKVILQESKYKNFLLDVTYLRFENMLQTLGEWFTGVTRWPLQAFAASCRCWGRIHRIKCYHFDSFIHLIYFDVLYTFHLMWSETFRLFIKYVQSKYSATAHILLNIRCARIYITNNIVEKNLSTLIQYINVIKINHCYKKAYHMQHFLHNIW